MAKRIFLARHQIRFCTPVLEHVINYLYQVCNFILASRVLGFCKVVQVSNFSFARIILRLGPPVDGGDLLLAGRVLGVELALQLGDVRDAGLVVLLLTLLKRSEVI